MKAFLIDTPNKQVVEVEYNGDYKQIYQHIRASMFTTVNLHTPDAPEGSSTAVFVDDEGLINGNPHGWFTLPDILQPLRGYGLVLGCNEEGASVEPFVTLEQLNHMVRFP